MNVRYMYMIDNKVILVAFLTILFSLISCNMDDEFSMPNLKPSDLSISSEILGADSDFPNGDGSGIVDFTFNATDATSYSVLINEEELEVAENTFRYTFTKDGTHNYSILVSAYNSVGFISASYEITVFVLDGLQLVWQDEFNIDGSPDATKWGYNIGRGSDGWGNNESQYYTSRLENAKVENGILSITAKKEAFEGSQYTSARLLTQGKFDFTYGRIDVSAKLPSGGGVWPAIWMLGANIETVGWPTCGEIDIMEYVGNNPGQISSALHTSSSFGATVNYKATPIDNETTEFHLYSMIWTEESITFLLDDVEFYTYNPSIKNAETWPFTQRQFIILNIAVGGTLGGNIDPNFGTSVMEIDFVRVYQ